MDVDENRIESPFDDVQMLPTDIVNNLNVIYKVKIFLNFVFLDSIVEKESQESNINAR